MVESIMQNDMQMHFTTKDKPIKMLVERAMDEQKKADDEKRLYRRQWNSYYTYVGMNFLRKNLKKCIEMLDIAGYLVIERRGKPQAVFLNMITYRRLVNMNELMERTLRKNKIDITPIIDETRRLEKSQRYIYPEDED